MAACPLLRQSHKVQAAYLLKHSRRKSLASRDRLSGSGGGSFDEAIWNMAATGAA